MSIKISSSTINKLGHDILEIRTRTLKHIEGKITRAFLQNEEVIFHPGCLLKQLIRWFGQKPLCEEEIVLNLMITILTSKYAHESIKFLGLERLKREVGKIYEIVKLSSCKKLVCDIKEILEKYVDLEDDSDIVLEINSGITTASTNDLGSGEDVIDDEFSPDYEKLWSSPSVPDYNSLKYLCDSLTCDSNAEELDHAFKYLQTALNDYPAEYFLQPPYIFKALLVLHTKDKRNSECLFSSFIKLTKSILGRVKMKRLATSCFSSIQENKPLKSKTQITVSRYCVELFNLCLQQLKEPGEDGNQDESFLNLSLLFEVLRLMENDPCCYIPKHSVLMDLAYIAKYYRQSLEIDQKPNRTDRVRYIIIVYLMVKVVDFGSCREKVSTPEISATKNAKNEYNPNNYHSVSPNESKISLLNNESDAWCEELEIALLDLPIQKFYPQLYESIKKSIKLEKRSETSTIRILLNSEKLLKPVIKLLREPDELSDEELIFCGLEALETLSIFRSMDLVKKLIHAISRCIPLFDGNVTLKEAAENILLRLFAHENLRIKRLTYKEASNSMKNFFGRLMEGELTLSKMYSSDLSKAKTLGIPLNVEVLTEIICFGCQHSDIIIRSSAETMLYLIIRGKSILGKHWESFLEILLPNLPLLQCLEPKDAGLGSAILNLLDPDNDFPVIDMIQGNIRFLFFDNAAIRSEALSRIIYIISSHSESNCYVPNVLQINDTLPNEICIVTAPRDPEKIFSGSFYDRSTVSALLELLKSPDVEPSVRKTTLLQLNVVCQDPELVDLIYCENGWYLALQALDNSLKSEAVVDYPDAAIPAIGIISKMALCNPQFRRELANEGNVYFLLMRALFIFHNDIVLQQDCALVIFLLVFSSYIVGSKQTTLPKICSRLKVPVKCDFHWTISPFEQKSLLEKIFLDVSKSDSDSAIPRQFPLALSSRSSSLITVDLCESVLSTCNNKGSIKMNGTIIESNALVKGVVFQFLRLTFACLWFEGVDCILKGIKGAKAGHCGLDYSIMPGSLDTNKYKDVITISEKLSFNKHLELTSNDILLIKYSSITENIQAFLKRIANATSCRDVTINVARIKLCLKLSPNHKVETEQFLTTLRRFLLIVPTSELDQIIFESIVEMLIQLLEANDDGILQWILEDLQDNNCVMLLLLKNYGCELNLYKKVCDFLKVVMKMCICNKQRNALQKYIISKDIDKKRKEFYNIFNRLFEYLVPVTEAFFHKRHLDHVRYLLSLLHVISCSKSVELSSGMIPLISKKFLYFIMTLKSFTQAGSHLTKNCLYIIGNLMDEVDEFIIDGTHIRFLSGICGHADFQVRALSWSILSKICKCLKGAHLVVKELSFLPGGFHACCLSTFLDSQEIPIVRETAGGVFSNLLTYPVNECDEGLHMSVAPLCVELDPAESSGIELVMQVFSKHRFLQSISSSLEYFHISEFVDNTTLKSITTCGIVKIYCSILINLIDLCPSMMNQLMETSGLLRIFELVKCVPTCVTKSSLEMAGAISNLLLRFIKPASTFLRRTISRDQELIVQLISLLNPLYFDNLDKTPLITVMQVLKTVGNESMAYQLICEIISSRYSAQVALLLCSSLSPCENNEYLKSCLKFIISLLVKGQAEEYKFETFAKILNFTKVNEGKFNDANPIEVTPKTGRRCTSLENLKNNPEESRKKTKLKRSLDKSEMDYVYASEIIFWKVKVLFEGSFCTRKSFENITNKSIIICEALAILLKTCSKTRSVAREINFLKVLIDRFDCNFKSMGMTCVDFIRKHGDSKKDPILQEFTLLYGIILNWFASDCLTDQQQILELSQIIMQSWPWVSHSNELRNQFIRCLAFLSEDSVPVCKQFSTTISNSSHSILQLTANMVTAETNKVKHPNVDFSVLEMGLRIISNCCCCIEGRLQIVKVNLLDTFNKFHPSVTKMQKSWNMITILWLKFWEIFSRYSEGAVVRHLVLICTLTAKGNPTIRNLCLSVMRNMAFLNANRAALLSSPDFLYTVNSVLTEGSFDEQVLVSTAVWRLVADNYKAKHVIKATSIPKKFNCILKKVTDSSSISEQNDLVNIIEIVLKILND